MNVAQFLFTRGYGESEIGLSLVNNYLELSVEDGNGKTADEETTIYYDRTSHRPADATAITN